VICTSPPEFPTLIEDFKKLAKEHPEFLRHATDSYHESRVRSVFAMAPALGPAFRPVSLAKIIVRADEKLNAFVELECQVLTVTFHPNQFNDGN